LVFAFSGMIVISLLPPPFFWGVEIGDKFTYTVSVRWEKYLERGTLWSDGEYITTIEITITNLPSLSNISTPWLFKEHVIHQIKGKATFVNYTGDYPVLRIYAGILSLAILPCGAWHAI